MDSYPDWRSVISRCTVCVLALGAAACGDGSVSAPSSSASSVVVTLQSPVIRVRETTQATATALLVNGQTRAVTNGFRSDTPSVATVSDNGLVTGVADGVANIYIISGGQQGLAQVRVAVFPRTITFGALAPERAFEQNVESGFTVTPRSGSWIAQSYGNPGPAVIFRGSDYLAPPISAEIEITKGGDTFTFSTVDLYSSVTRIPWEFIGFRGSVALFTTSGEQGNTFGRFVTTTNPRASESIDRLVIRLTQPTNTTCPTCAGNPMGLDNIVLF